MTDEAEDWQKLLLSSTVEVVKSGGPREQQADALVCRLAPRDKPLILPDNLVGHCGQCFRMIQFRPHVPKEIARICEVCVMKLVDESKREGDPVRVLITENTAADIVEYARRKRMS